MRTTVESMQAAGKEIREHNEYSEAELCMPSSGRTYLSVRSRKFIFLCIDITLNMQYTLLRNNVNILTIKDGRRLVFDNL